MNLPSKIGLSKIVDGAKVVKIVSKHGADTLVYVVLAVSTLGALAYVGAPPLLIAITGGILIAGWLPFVLLSAHIRLRIELKHEQSGLNDIKENRGYFGILKRLFRTNK